MQKQNPNPKSPNLDDKIEDDDTKLNVDKPQTQKTKAQDSSSQKDTPKTVKSSRSSKEPSTMEELLSQTDYKLKGIKRGDIVEAKILSVTPRHILLDVGGKGEAVIHEKEMPYISDLVTDLKVGDKVTVYVVVAENDRGQTVVSLRKMAMSKRWEMLDTKKKNSEMVDVTIRELSRGGFLVDYLGLRGFIPLSQVDSDLVRQAEKATGRRVSVKIIEVDKDANRLVFSQIAGGVSEKHQAALGKVEIGKTYTAQVTGIAPFGAFVNVKIDEGVQLSGLIHISEIAWEKVEDTATYLKVGQAVEVKAIGADPKSGKLTLSLKQLLQDPWQDVIKVFSIDQHVRGKVSRMSQFGAFISLLPGIDGLIHISKMAPGEEPKVGDEIECVIEEINPDKRKISLSLISLAKPIGYR